MNVETSAARSGFDRLKHEWLLLLFATLTIALEVVNPRPLSDYRHWLQLPALAGLLGLLITIQGIRDSGIVQRCAGALIARMHSVRGVGLLLVTSTTVLSMVLTNDVSLFLLVPLTLVIGGMSNLPIARMVVLEALAVNAGSTLSPIGNPQNLLLWQHAGISFLHFVGVMLPTAMVMFAMVAALTWLWLPRERVALDTKKLDGHAISRPLASLSVAGLIAMVLTMEYGHALIGASGIALLFALFSWRSVARIDWLLLATFTAIFLGLGHFATLPWVSGVLGQLDFTRPLTLYVGGIVASQLISNVPATVLLIDRVHDTHALAIAVNVGGFGIVIGSLANLIALRLAKQPHGLRLFHWVSIPFLCVCAPLVYLTMQWLR